MGALSDPSNLLPVQELSRRVVGSICDCCGAVADGKLLKKKCSSCRRKAYCSSACQHQDWKEGGHKRACRPQKEYDVVLVQDVQSQPHLNGQLMVVVSPATAELRWRVLGLSANKRKCISLHSDKLRLIVAAEERKGCCACLEPGYFF